MKDFGAALHEALLASTQTEVEQARALARIGASAIDKALELARGVAELASSGSQLQLQATLAEVEAQAMMARKAAAAGVVAGSAIGVGGTAALGAAAYGVAQGNRRMEDALRSASEQLHRQFLPQRAAEQYRAEGEGGGDPLTGIQNSRALQDRLYDGAQGLQMLAQANRWALNELSIQDPLALLPESVQGVARGLAKRALNVTPQEAARNLAYSGGQWYVPPALGSVRGVASKTPQGRDTPLEQQHGIGGVINGLETRKAGDINRLLASTGQPGPASDYIGPTKT